VFVVTDASGTFNEGVQQAAWARMSAAGAQLMNWFSVACELQGDWRNDMEGLGNLLSEAHPELSQPDEQLHHVHSQVRRSKDRSVPQLLQGKCIPTVGAAERCDLCF
jgi:hypothetical protein